MAGKFHLWSKTAADNDDADNTIAIPEGMPAGNVNDEMRDMMAAIASHRDDTNSTLATTGSSNTYAVTSNQAITALISGLELTVRANHTNTGAATLNLNTIGAKAIRGQGDVALIAGQMVSGGVYRLYYNAAANGAAGAWMLPSSAAGVFTTAALSGATFTHTVTSDGGLGADWTITHDSTTPASGDVIWSVQCVGDDAGGNPTNYGLFEVGIDDTTNPGGEDGFMRWRVCVAGTQTSKLILHGETSSLSPAVSDGTSLGRNSGGSNLFWSDIYLASGATININDGDVILTHSSNKLAMTGGVFDAVGGLTVNGSTTFSVDAGSGAISIGNNQVLQGQGAAITDALTAGSATAANCATTINTLLARCRAHGFIDT